MSVNNIIIQWTTPRYIQELCIEEIKDVHKIDRSLNSQQN